MDHLVGQAILTTDPAERAWIEDQITCNLYARRLLCGNSQVVVIDAGEAGVAGYQRSDFRDGDIGPVAGIVARRGWRLILGSELFTPSDRPRKYPAGAR